MQPVPLADFLARVHERIEEVEPLAGEGAADRAWPVLERDGYEGRPGRFGHLGQLVSEEFQGVMAVAAGMEEEHEDRGLARHFAEIKGLAPDGSGREGGGLGIAEERAGLGDFAGDAQGISQFIGDDPRGVFLLCVEAWEGEIHIALGVCTQDDQGRWNAQQGTDVRIGIIDDGKIEAVRLGKFANLGCRTAYADAHDLEIVTLSLLGHRGNGVSHRIGSLGFWVEEEEDHASADQGRHGETRTRKRPPGEAGEGALAGSARGALCALLLAPRGQFDIGLRASGRGCGCGCECGCERFLDGRRGPGGLGLGGRRRGWLTAGQRDHEGEKKALGEEKRLVACGHIGGGYGGMRGWATTIRYVAESE